MSLILIPIGLLLAGGGIWLWFLGRARRTSFESKGYAADREISRRKPVYATELARALLTPVWRPTISLLGLLSFPPVTLGLWVVSLAVLLPLYYTDLLEGVYLLALVWPVLFFACFVALFRRGYFALEPGELMSAGKRVERRKTHEAAVEMPSKVYAGDSHKLSVVIEHDLKMSLAAPGIDVIQCLEIQDSEGARTFELGLVSTAGSEDRLEVEVLAAGLEVAGDRRQQQSVRAERLLFNWNCYFPNSGRLVVSLALRTTKDDSSVDLGTVDYHVRVTKLDGLTQRQVWMIARFLGVVAGALAAAEILHELGAW